jgi:tetratricopeptide (TPR) repeat protein
MIRSFLETGEWRRSADCSRLWIKQYGHEPLIHAMYAEAQRNLRNFRSAFNHLEQAIKTEPRNIHLWYEQLMTAWEAEDWKAMEKSLRNIERISGQDDTFRRFNTLLKVQTTQDNKEAVALLQKAIGSMGPEPELMYALGENYLKTGLTDLALNWFKKTVTVQETHEKAWLGIISCLEALATAPPGGVTGLLSKAGRQEEARRAQEIAGELRTTYDRYIKRWPDNFQIRRDKALYLIRAGEYAEAAGELEALLAWEPSNFSLRRVLAYAYRKTGRYREAAVYLKPMLRENPGAVDILLEYTGCLERTGASHYAVVLLEKARIQIKKNGEIPMALSLLYAKEEKKKKAFALLMEAVALNKKDPRPYQLMAKLAAQKGDKAGAKKYQREADSRGKA